MRTCTKCASVFPATLEYFIAAQQGRLRGECKACTAKDHAARYQRNKESHNAKNRKWVKANPDARRQHTKNYREKNKDKCKASVHAWFMKDIEHARSINREKVKRWYRNNLEDARAIRRAAVKRRRALKRGAGISKLTHAEWISIQELYEHRCAYCKKKCKGKLTQDHVVPLHKGGHHIAKNVVPACMTCNCSKKTSAPPIPIAQLKFLPTLL